MELTWWQMLLILKIGSVADFIGCASLLSMVLCVLAVVGSFIDKITGVPHVFYDALQQFNVKRYAIASTVIFVFSLAIPTKEEIALIYFVPAIVNNQDVQSIPPELAKLARVKIEQMVKETITEEK